jgi:hypothetical protein
MSTNAFPPELHPGIDYAAYVLDPKGHCIQLYYYMEQVGCDVQRQRGTKAPIDTLARALELFSDAFSGEPFLGR